MRKLLPIILIFSAAFALLASNADALTCTTRLNSCIGSEIPVLRFNNTAAGYSGGHAAIWNQTSYVNVICCDEPGDTLYRNCNRPGNETVFNLTAVNNSHVQVKAANPFSSNYDIQVCLSSQLTKTIDCRIGYFGSDCSGWPLTGLGYTCVASINETSPMNFINTNAHVGDCAAYLKEVCCKAGLPSDSNPPVTTPTVSCPLPGNNGWCRADVTVTLSCNDGSGVGCDTTQYCTDTGTPCSPSVKYTAPVVISTEGVSYIRYGSNDTASNTENPVKSTQLKIDKQIPKADSVAYAPSAVESYGNVTFTPACSDPVPGSGCITINITANTTPKSSCLINFSLGETNCQIQTPDPSKCVFGIFNFNATAEDYAGWTNTSLGNLFGWIFTVKRAEGCSCSENYECISGFCEGEPPLIPKKCTVVSPPVITTPTTSNDLVVLLGSQGRLIVNVKNNLRTTDRISLSVTGNPAKLQNWIWFDSHRYDNSKYNITMELGPGEEKTIAIDIFGGQVTAGSPPTLDGAPTAMRVVAKSSITGLEAELSRGVSIVYSEDGMSVQTPDIGWLGIMIIALLGAAAMTKESGKSRR